MVKRAFTNRKMYALLMLGIGLVGITGLLAACSSSQYSSNGERIYYTATSSSGDRITYTGGFTMMQPLACVNCHGPNGKGGSINMMMYSFEAPDITWTHLTADVHPDHPPYTEATVKQAITEGVDPAGNPLDEEMPRWSMSSSDLNDLINFMKTLK